MLGGKRDEEVLDSLPMKGMWFATGFECLVPDTYILSVTEHLLLSQVAVVHAAAFLASAGPTAREAWLRP